MAHFGGQGRQKASEGLAEAIGTRSKVK
jgi:hypothetical protein